MFDTAVTREDMRALVPVRTADSHKGEFGRVLVVAGSAGAIASFFQSGDSR